MAVGSSSYDKWRVTRRFARTPQFRRIEESMQESKKTERVLVQRVRAKPLYEHVPTYFMSSVSTYIFRSHGILLAAYRSPSTVACRRPLARSIGRSRRRLTLAPTLLLIYDNIDMGIHIPYISYVFIFEYLHETFRARHTCLGIPVLSVGWVAK